MHDEKFEIISFFQKTISTSKSGRVHIVGKDVEWCLDIDDGRLLFAAHSLQYLTTLENVLPSLGYEAALPVYWRLVRSDLFKHQSGGRGLDALGWTCRLVSALTRYNALSLEQAERTLAKLSEDAVESLLGLETATVSWHPLPKEMWHTTIEGVAISPLLDYLTQRSQLWQSVCDRIISPHQRPYCDNPADLYQSVPQGLLPHQMLKALARLMQGASIRQLAQAVKQDEVKLAKLLYPYIRHRVIKLWPPVQPLDRLPWLPEATQGQPTQAANLVTPTVSHRNAASGLAASGRLAANSRPLVNRVPASNLAAGANSGANSGANNNPEPDTRVLTHQSGSSILDRRSSTESKSRYLIICIDDSQAMLEKIDSYLDPEHFELKTVIDPVASVSKICAMKPDLVLMDVSMPSINGNSFCQILRRSYMFKDVPIIMISSNAGPLNKATAESSGATDYLEKPFSKAQLMKVLETYLETQGSL